MHLSDHSGVKCIIGTLFVVALLKANMTPVACVYGADCKMQDQSCAGTLYFKVP